MAFVVLVLMTAICCAICRGDFKPPTSMHRNIPRFLNRLLGLPLDTQVLTTHVIFTAALPGPASRASTVRFCRVLTKNGVLDQQRCACLCRTCDELRCNVDHSCSCARTLQGFRPLWPQSAWQCHLPPAACAAHHCFAVLQECMFAYFSSTLDAVITAAKSRGDFDNGIVTLKGMTSIELMHQDVVHKDRFSGADCGLFW